MHCGAVQSAAIAGGRGDLESCFSCGSRSTQAQKKAVVTSTRLRRSASLSPLALLQ